MKEWGHFFKGKKITVMGLGLLGRGVGDAKFLAEQGAELIVTDLKDAEALSSSIEVLSSYTNITYRLGEHNLEDFKDRDFILKAAGVPLENIYINEARKNKIPIKMSASWFAELAKIPVVGVTGTRGKTTTTYMLYSIMQSAGMEVLLGGNIRGVSTLALLPQATPDSVALFELDSWQCQGWGEDKMSPNVSVFTTFMDDHLTYYGGNVDLYLKDKAQIFLHQKPDDTLVVGSSVATLLKDKYGNKIVSKVVIASPEKFPKGWTLNVPGDHNKLNAMCAVEAARALGIDDEEIREGLENFKGVAGRLELVREVNGVKIYNDTTATTPDATLVALKTLGSENRLREGSGESRKNIILIMGGTDKGIAIEGLLSYIPEVIKKVVFLSGNGTDKILNHFPDTVVHDALAPAFEEAIASARSGDIVILSPGFSSKGMFTNEYDRGDQFNDLVAKL